MSEPLRVRIVTSMLWLSLTFLLEIAGSAVERHEITALLTDAARHGRPAPMLVPMLAPLLAPAGRAAARSPPKINPQWSATLRFDGDMMGQVFEGGVGKFHYDMGRRYRLSYKVQSTLFRPDGMMEQDQLSELSSGSMFNMTIGGVGQNGVCLPFQGEFHDLFSFLSIAEAVGHKLLDGRRCEVWKMEVDNYVMSACIADDGMARELKQGMKGGGAFSGSQTYSFSEVVTGDPGDESFRSSFACSSNYPTQACPDKDVETLDSYRIFGVGEPKDLTNRDAGDVLGDVSFICTQGSGASYRSKLITHWSVRVRKTFGQYALCNFNGTNNVCSGAPAQLAQVGRRGSQFQARGPVQGQCSPNTDVGSQYSFPEAAKCGPGELPGPDAACAWGDARPLRTVWASCVMEDRGLLKMCEQEFGHAPFSKSAQIFQAAFETDDPALGGCPDAQVGSTELIV
eukprot:gb/GFBE01078839.1/.p1 GENE.gb/GFBE01078839.1/~~gb/GFBE01078839.1/.p1  ORF type:complete len:455 (+),score=73.31 gb/GFBE01078839.1/:1-1365(+)